MGSHYDDDGETYEQEYERKIRRCLQVLQEPFPEAGLTELSKDRLRLVLKSLEERVLSLCTERALDLLIKEKAAQLFKDKMSYYTHQRQE